MYQALYRKYRPRTFSDVVGQAHITDTLQSQVADDRLSHAYLFTGTRGTGKTTCAKILARAVNCEHPVDGNPCNECPSCLGIENGSVMDVLELDAASNNGVDQVRALRDEAIYTPASVKKRVYIVDEVHMLSTAAFNALLKILEEPPAHLMFILATTELHKVPATIKSRCQQFSFKRILPGDISAHLSRVAALEHIDLTPDGAALLARLADGGLRDALSLLDQCNLQDGTVGETEILATLGMAGNLETGNLMGQLALNDTAGALETLSRLYREGKEMKTLLGELSSLARDLLIRKTAPQGGAALLTGGYDEATLRRLSEHLNAPRLVQMVTILQDALLNLGRSANQRTDAELTLIRLADETLDGGVLGLSARVARLETMMEYPPAAVATPPQKPAAPPVSVAPQPAPAKAEVPPVAEESAPWEEDIPLPDAPPELSEPAMSISAQPAVTAEVPAPKPPTATPEPTADGPADSALWPALLPALKGKVPPTAWPFLSNGSMTTGSYADGVLTLTVNSAVTKTMTDKPEIHEVIAAQAQLRVGCPVRVKMVLQEPAPNDKLNDLMAMGAKFGN
ncbi:MAG: DNA polymerase III subunit gamma/tau [Oscillospiraceae bacterium]